MTEKRNITARGGEIGAGTHGAGGSASRPGSDPVRQPHSDKRSGTAQLPDVLQRLRDYANDWTDEISREDVLVALYDPPALRSRSVGGGEEMTDAHNDGYDLTVVLDCGDVMRLATVPGFRDPRAGDWYACSSHSEIIGYDPDNGDPNYNRDRQVTEVRREL